ncbi:GGDEF domain-containing protein [Marinobacter sp. C2H3]|uniref:GGDEF domain-containing protein n=1 Tax=Marinobacter sp. C2H3 TaxID=3119003 RepID=UPI00300E98E5
MAGGHSSNDSRGPASIRRPAFWQLALRCTQIAATVDVAFFGLFLALDSPVLAWVNVISVAMYVAAYVALKRKHNRVAVWLIWTEVLVHAALGIVMIGWGSGFHYYLLMFIPAICLSAPRRWVFRGLAGLWGYYVALDILMWFVAPLQPIPQSALHVVHVFNLTVVFAMFSYLSVFYLGMVIRAQKQLHKAATTDALTGLLNRRQMQYLLEQEVERFRRSGQPVSLLLMDLDHFKRINDTLGHETGDDILKAFANILRQELRAQDLVARWGGEEFLAILPQTTPDAALQTAERLRGALAAHNALAAVPADSVTVGTSDSEGASEGQVTVSIGVTDLRAMDTATTAVSRADTAMYQSKEAGRNRVTVYDVSALSGHSATRDPVGSLSPE